MISTSLLVVILGDHPALRKQKLTEEKDRRPRPNRSIMSDAESW
jgi:hypothetical protein